MNERLQAIDAAIQFVENRLRDPITVADIAAAAGYSLYHFIRTFNQIVQHRLLKRMVKLGLALRITLYPSRPPDSGRRQCSLSNQ